MQQVLTSDKIESKKRQGDQENHFRSNNSNNNNLNSHLRRITQKRDN